MTPEPLAESGFDRRRVLGLGAAATVAALSGVRQASAARPLALATLKFGTVSWLLDTIAAEGFDRREGFALARTDLASTQAVTVALQAGQADLIVSDWGWAMRRRNDGEPLRFAAYSSALGALMVPADSPIATLKDLTGKKVGVAGGPLDKSWLLLRARAHDEVRGDIGAMLEPVFGAPPLLSEQLRLGRIDAVLTFWPFAARLDAEGFRRLIDVGDILRQLRIDPPPPLVGFVWRETLEKEMGPALDGFFRAVAAANATLKTSDAAWERLRPTMQVKSDAEFLKVRDYYRAGIAGPWTGAELAGANRLYGLLTDLGGADFVGRNPRFDAGLFFTPRA